MHARLCSGPRPRHALVKLSSLEEVFGALHEASVRYLVAGGVAVNAHGYQRMTQDLDLVLDLSRENVVRAMDALGGLGYRPALPADAEELADPEIRRRWHEERNMQVFSLVRPSDPGLTVDVFVREPFDFDTEHERAMIAEIAPDLPVPFVAARSLIRMKEAVGRPRDLDDAEHLRWIMEEREEGRDHD